MLNREAVAIKMSIDSLGSSGTLQVCPKSKQRAESSLLIIAQGMILSRFPVTDDSAPTQL